MVKAQAEVRLALKGKESIDSKDELSSREILGKEMCRR